MKSNQNKKPIGTFQQIKRIETDVLLKNGSHQVELLLIDGSRWIGNFTAEQFKDATEAELTYEIKNTPTERKALWQKQNNVLTATKRNQ